MNFLAKMLGEASEATQLSGQLSENIIRVIERDLKSLQQMDTSNLSRFEMRDYERRVSFLRLALATHRQFLMSLKPIHITITDLLYSLETLGLAESAALTLEMGQRTQRLDQVEQVKEIIEGLNRMDSFLNDLNANARVIEDAQIID